MTMQNTKISKNIDETITQFLNLFDGCADIKHRILYVGQRQSVKCMFAYVETTAGNLFGAESMPGQLLAHMNRQEDTMIADSLLKNAPGLSEMAQIDTVEMAGEMMLSGDVILFVDGLELAMKLPADGYPSRGITETESEKVVRGSNEGFSESVKANCALIRKRLRTSGLKVEELSSGIRSQTNVSVLYLKDLAYPQLLSEIKKRLSEYEVDGVLDSGVLEQLSEKSWFSPFPQFQTTERPDLAAKSLLEGRIVILSDNSPEALILPTTYVSFVQTTDDYYNRFEIASFTRILRYIASFFAVAFPGLYLAVTNYHTELLPTELVIFFAKERDGVPFAGVVELLLMELGFELLREAGVRLPTAMSNTIGIVGGLVIGQAAVDAGLVSPMVVIVVAFTALCSFAIPSEEFATAFRLLKFALIVLCAAFGFFGFLYGVLFVLIHLSGLESFGIPYLMPYAAGEVQGYKKTNDTWMRAPYRMLKYRPVYAKRNERRRLKRKG
jgi:spore germination protein